MNDEWENYDPEKWGEGGEPGKGLDRTDEADEVDDGSEEGAAAGGDSDHEEETKSLTREPGWWKNEEGDDEETGDAETHAPKGDATLIEAQQHDESDDDGYLSASDAVVPEGMIMGYDDDGRFVIEDGPDSWDSDAESGAVAEFHDAQAIPRPETLEARQSRLIAEWRDWAVGHVGAFPEFADVWDWGWDEWDAWRYENAERVAEYHRTQRLKRQFPSE